MPRYVLLEHDYPHRHWDLMLEQGETLKTWRLAAPPTPENPVLAEMIGDHRPIYLDYEGPVSGQRGIVRRWDRGEIKDVEPSRDLWVVCVVGRLLEGTLKLRRISEQLWECVYSPTARGGRP
jgi:hypothetical protein